MKILSLTCCALIVAAALSLAPQAWAQAGDAEAHLEDITNYVKISNHLSTSGQIAYDQIEAIKEAGFEVVINLAPARDDVNGLEGYLVVEQGMSYVHIPVSWQQPSQRDLQLFFDMMKANHDRKVYVHCFANMRVSAFVYLYRTLKEDITEEQARADLEKIWKPEDLEQWAAFIETARAEHE